ncbi:unnamed protein product [Rhizophagus irregularis]|nr:unnamed protein product [Rhizophagus irregularis]
MWKEGLLKYNISKKKYTRKKNEKVALKCLYNSQNITGEFLNEIKAYSIKGNGIDNILPIYGISQIPNTKEYIMVLYCAREGNYNSWVNKNNKFDWKYYLGVLSNIISGLKKMHQNKMVHRDLHIGNILVNYNNLSPSNNLISISDMGLCSEVGNTDEKNVYGVMPYIAPEILRGRPYTEAADIYSFGMVMYFVATERQPFSDRAHDQCLVLDICDGINPNINELEAPECYIDLMKKCWDLNPNNRPNAIEIEKKIELFNISYQSDKPLKKNQQHYEIEKQFEEAEEYRKLPLSSIEKNKQIATHPQAIYTSRLLNPFTKVLHLRSECFECEIVD